MEIYLVCDFSTLLRKISLASDDMLIEGQVRQFSAFTAARACAVNVLFAYNGVWFCALGCKIGRAEENGSGGASGG